MKIAVLGKSAAGTPATSKDAAFAWSGRGMFSPMGSIGRYMFRATMGAFLITLVSLTVVIWFTQAMRDFDLITSQPQTLLVFVGITGMIIPPLVMMIAPIALVIATAQFGFRNYRNERGGFTLAIASPIPGGGARGFAPGRDYRRLPVAAQFA